MVFPSRSTSKNCHTARTFINVAASRLTSSTAWKSSIAFGSRSAKQLFEVPLKPKMPSVQHERIDVAPNLRQIRYRANPAVQVRRRRDRMSVCTFGLRRSPMARNNFALNRSG